MTLRDHRFFQFIRSRIRLNQHELAGAFGDVGTDLPLLAGMLLVSDFNATSVLVVFGLMQVAAGVVYGIPMAVQPLKAVAALVIAQNIAAPVVFGAGLSMGLFMLALSLSGMLEKFARLIPKAVVRGIQLGLGVNLALLAARKYIPADGAVGLYLAGTSFILILLLRRSSRLPGSLVVLGLGVMYVLMFKMQVAAPVKSFHFALPQFQGIQSSAVVEGFFALAIAQIPLSLGNSILATAQLARDYYPQRNITAEKIGLTYGVMNLVAPFFGGVPVCHGSGGLAGHHFFGARTGGSVVIYGTVFIIGGLFFSDSFGRFLQAFPLSILGTILIFEGWSLARSMRDARAAPDFGVALLVAACAIFLPYGYAVGIIAGTLTHGVLTRRNKPAFAVALSTPPTTPTLSTKPTASRELRCMKDV